MQLRLVKAVKRVWRQYRKYRKERWYEFDMKNYARRTLDMIAAEDRDGKLRSRTTLGQVEVLRAMAGRA